MIYCLCGGGCFQFAPRLRQTRTQSDLKVLEFQTMLLFRSSLSLPQKETAVDLRRAPKSGGDSTLDRI